MRRIAVVLLLFTACRLPTDPRVDCAADVGCSEKSARYVSPSDVQAAQLRAVDRLRHEIETGAVVMRKAVDWNRLPRVEFVACPYWVGNADCSPTGVSCGSGVCAAGSTESVDRIKVSTFEEARTIPLVEWETRNALLVQGGRSDLAF